jgi:hypothetical protein
MMDSILATREACDPSLGPHARLRHEPASAGCLNKC